MFSVFKRRELQKDYKEFILFKLNFRGHICRSSEHEIDTPNDEICTLKTRCKLHSIHLLQSYYQDLILLLE